MYSGIFLCRPSSWSRRTTNSMSMVDRAGRKPHCSSGSICCASQKSLRRLVTIFSSTLPAWETSEIPRKLLQSDRSDFLWSTLIVASFHSCGISSPLHTRTRMAWKCLRTTGSRVGSSSLSSSTGSESAPGASSLPLPGLPSASPRTLALPGVILAPRFATLPRAAAAAVPSSAAVPSRRWMVGVWET